MAKTAQTQNTPGENKKRLQEIAEIQFGTLSDDEALRFLAERKRLSDLEREYEKIQEEETARLEQKKKEDDVKRVAKEKALTLQKIEELNKSISPDKPDEDLLHLIGERKKLEEELAVLNGEVAPEKEESLPATPPLQVVEVSPQSEQQAVVPEEEILSEEEKEETVIEAVQQGIKTPVGEEYGVETIRDDSVGIRKFQIYLDKLKDNIGSLGELLQGMPLEAKKNKAFMLKVAEIDPAYAMHYADTETLKRDEDFNLRIASLDNPRNSGNALAEMLPEARTSKVLLAAVKQDYRNVKFIQPRMANYDEMIDIAKKSTLEKVKNLKDAVDIMTLVPKLLQHDKQFMLQVRSLTEPEQAA